MHTAPLIEHEMDFIFNLNHEKHIQTWELFYLFIYHAELLFQVKPQTFTLRFPVCSEADV